MYVFSVLCVCMCPCMCACSWKHLPCRANWHCHISLTQSHSLNPKATVSASLAGQSTAGICISLSDGANGMLNHVQLFTD